MHRPRRQGVRIGRPEDDAAAAAMVPPRQAWGAATGRRRRKKPEERLAALQATTARGEGRRVGLADVGNTAAAAAEGEEARSGCSRCGSLDLQGLCWQGCGATTAMRPVFDALQRERLHSAQLRQTLEVQRARADELQAALEQRTAQKEVLQTLQADIDLVNSTAVTLGRELQGAAATAALGGPTAGRVVAERDWQPKVLRLIFTRFDVNRDGALSCVEWNELQRALGSTAPPLSPLDLKHLCAKHQMLHLSLESGVAMAGLQKWYESQGDDQLRRDARTLGVLCVESAVDFMVAAIDALKQVRTSAELAASISSRVQGEAEDERQLGGQLRQTLDVLQERLAESQSQVRALEQENDGLRAAVTEAREESQSQVESALSRVGGLEDALSKARGAVVEINGLLMAKVEEKELLQRDLWLVQQDHQELLKWIGTSQQSVWQANEGRREAKQEAMRLHGELRRLSQRN